jgi:aryl-alcohol dehydrogenase-like predicted oxidoreductase
VEQRELGASGLRVSALGLGCMGMSEFYGTPDEREAIRTIHRALELGVTLLDTADMYGRGANERLVGRALAGRREQAVVATKFGIVRTDDGAYGYDGRPEYVRSACDSSLERLGVDVIDLYQLHRVDPKTPIEETVGAMGELVTAGKVRFLGLSEAQPVDLRRAAAVAPISTLQNEYSLFERGIERETLSVCEELGIGVLAYAPLGRGMLTGRYEGTGGLEEGDWRRRAPRWADENLTRNLDLVARVEALAAGKGVTAGRLALAWLLHRRPWIAPIPGTKRVAYLEENAAAASVALTPEEVEELSAAVPPGAVAGERYPPERMPTWTSPPAGSAPGGGGLSRPRSRT